MTRSATGFRRRKSAGCAKAPLAFQGGLTLSELLAVVAVVAILSSVAIPSLASMYATNTLNNAQENLTGVFKKARGWAVSHGTIVTVQLRPATNIVQLITADNSLSQTIVLPSSVSINANSDYIFNPAGTSTSGSSMLASVLYPNISPRTVTVTVMGQVNVSR